MIDNKVEAIKKHVEEIMSLLGLPKTDSNANTPLRVAKMYCNELFVNRNNSNLDSLDSQMKVFVNVDDSHEPITFDCPLISMCEHHWMPFYGTVSITYVPRDCILGLSKFARVVKYFSKRPQIQERLTKEIGEYLSNLLNPLSLFVVVTCEHTCVSARGIESPCETITRYTMDWTRGDK